MAHSKGQILIGHITQPEKVPNMAGPTFRGRDGGCTEIQGLVVYMATQCRDRAAGEREVKASVVIGAT